MSWRSSAVLLTLSLFGVGSLVYLLLNRDNEDNELEYFGSHTSRNTVIEVKIPKESVGIVIGRGGSNIKEIQTKSDTRINFRDEKEGSDLRVCVIRGTSEGAQFAESLIHEIIINQPLIETYEMFVPNIACGRIIGKNGENIRAITRNSSAKITVENGPVSPVNHERRIIIKGTAEQIAAAKILVEQKVEEDQQFRSQIESNVANRSPRHKAKYLLAGTAEMVADQELRDHKEKLQATGSDGLLEVYVSSTESPDRLWLQVVGPSTGELDRLNDQMTDYYNKEENRALHFLTEVSIGQPVAAPFPYDEKWYRAEVEKMNEDEYDPDKTQVTLHYVDYGDFATCSKNSVLGLRTDFLRLRYQAIECILAKVKPRGDVWTEEANAELDDLVHVSLWKSLTAKVHSYKERPTRGKRDGSPVPCVELFDIHGTQEVNVAEELVNKGLAVWDNADTNSANSTATVNGCKNDESSTKPISSLLLGNGAQHSATE